MGTKNFLPPYLFRINKSGFFEEWVMAWASLLDGLIGIATLGIVHSSSSFQATAWTALRELRRCIDEI